MPCHHSEGAYRKGKGRTCLRRAWAVRPSRGIQPAASVDTRPRGPGPRNGRHPETQKSTPGLRPGDPQSWTPSSGGYRSIQAPEQTPDPFGPSAIALDGVVHGQVGQVGAPLLVGHTFHGTLILLQRSKPESMPAVAMGRTLAPIGHPHDGGGPCTHPRNVPGHPIPRTNDLITTTDPLMC